MDTACWVTCEGTIREVADIMAENKENLHAKQQRRIAPRLKRLNGNLPDRNSSPFRLLGFRNDCWGLQRARWTLSTLSWMKVWPRRVSAGRERGRRPSPRQLPIKQHDASQHCMTFVNLMATDASARAEERC